MDAPTNTANRAPYVNTTTTTVDAEGSARECVFYWHATANDAEVLVSHQHCSTVAFMLYSVYKRTQAELPDALKHKRAYYGAAETRATTSDGPHARQVPEMDEREYSCVDMKRAGVPVALPGLDSTYVLGQDDAEDVAILDPAASPQGFSKQRRANPRCDPTSLLGSYDTRKSSVAKLNPLALPVNGYISMFSKHAEYDHLTCCNTTAKISSACVVQRWMSLVRCAASCLLTEDGARDAFQKSWCFIEDEAETVDGHDAQQNDGETCRRQHMRHATATTPAQAMLFHCFDELLESGAAASLSGVFVQRRSHTEFQLGVVTHTGRVVVQTSGLLRYLACLVQQPFAAVHQTLPLGAAWRDVTLKTWWTPHTARVTPGSFIAPIKIILEEKQLDHAVLRCFAMDSQGRRVSTPDVHLFRGYRDVTWFLARPITSQLCGTCSMRVPHDSVFCDDWLKGDDSLSACTQGRWCHAMQKNAIEESESADHVTYRRGITRGSSGSARATWIFGDLRVTGTGEHLLAVEARPSPLYRPFVPTLCAHIAPFLVVDPAEA